MSGYVELAFFLKVTNVQKPQICFVMKSMILLYREITKFNFCDNKEG